MIKGVNDGARKEIVKDVALGRLGKLEDVANVIFSFSSPLSNYVNGETIDVDGHQIMM